MDVEEKLRQLAGMVKRMRKSEKDNYPQNANLISATFDDNQRRTLYALLEEIVEGVPWQGVRWLYPDEMRDALDESSGKI